jgi:hypothetical protein
MDAPDNADMSGNQEQAQAEEAKQPHDPMPRYAKILRFIVTPILAVAAVACAVFATLSATIWRPDPTAKASMSASTRYIVTDPGVLSLANNDVTISATSDTEFCMAIGSSQDTAGWVASHKYTRVKGLSTWSTLEASTQTAASDTSATSGATSAENSQSLALKDSDMWLSTKCGTGTVDLSWKSTNADQSLIIDTNPSGSESDATGSKATVSLQWVRSQVLDLTTPLAFLAALLLIGAILSATVFAIAPQRRRKKMQEREAAAAEAGSEASGENTGVGLDSPRWVHDHVAVDRRKHRTSHRDDTRKKKSALFTRRRKETEEPVDSEADAAQSVSTPSIVDVKSVNLVAQQQDDAETGGEESNDAESASVSQDALSEYFSRLAEERLGDEEEEDDDVDDVTAEESEPDVPEEVEAADEEAHKND